MSILFLFIVSPILLVIPCYRSDHGSIWTKVVIFKIVIKPLFQFKNWNHQLEGSGLGLRISIQDSTIQIKFRVKKVFLKKKKLDEPESKLNQNRIKIDQTQNPQEPWKSDSNSDLKNLNRQIACSDPELELARGQVYLANAISPNQRIGTNSKGPSDQMIEGIQ